MTATAWSGRAVTQARAIVVTWLPAPCGHCGKTVTPRDRWVVGHKIARSLRPDLMFEVSNWRPEHRACSDASAQQAVIAKARADALREIGVFSSQEGPAQSPPLPFSPSSTSQSPVEPRADLRWSPETLSAYEWLQPFLDVPPDASPPLAMTPPPPDAVGSYGADAIAWIEETQRIRLRWWQRLAITRQLEHREDGSLCHEVVVESAPRRAGKSVRIRGLVLWRMEHGADLFGEPQVVVHTGSDIAVCRKVQKDAWRWAEANRWVVTRANGKEAIETPEDDQWLVRAQSSVYGWDTGFGVVDEAWDVKPDTVSEGLEPSLLERQSPQLHLTSTAHRRATSLMRTRLTEALTIEDPSTLLLLWAAPPGSDPGAEETWRAASPHWSESRRRYIASKYAKALAGEADPEADDPDPMAGFEAQYLNRWRLRERATHGEALVSEDDWTALAAEAPFIAPDAAAIESWFSEGVSLVLGWRIADRVVLSATDHADLAGAAEALAESGFKGTATVGSSLMTDPALTGVRKKPGQGRTGNAVQDLQRLLAEDAVRHDGTEHLTTQVLAVRTLPGTDGPRVVSKGRADAIKAVVWAIENCRAAKSLGKPRILLPSAS